MLSLSCVPYADGELDMKMKLFNIFLFSKQHHMAEKPVGRPVNVKLSIDLHCSWVIISYSVDASESLYMVHVILLALYVWSPA